MPTNQDEQPAVTSYAEQYRSQITDEHTSGSNDGQKASATEANNGQEGTRKGAVDQVEDGVIISSRDQSGTHLVQHPPQPPLHLQRRRVVSLPSTAPRSPTNRIGVEQQGVVNRDDSLNTTRPGREGPTHNNVIALFSSPAQARPNSLSPRGRPVSCSTLDYGPPGIQQPVDAPRYTSPARLRSQSPEDFRTRRSSTGRLLHRVPEDSEMDPSTLHQQNGASSRDRESQRLNQTRGPGYGSVSHQRSQDTQTHYVVTSDPLGDDSDDDSSTSEEEEWILDEELAREGLYRGNYKRLMTLYTFVPLTTILAFVFLSLLPIVALPRSSPSSPPYPYPRYVPYPLPEILTATALWSVSYLLRDFFYTAPLTCMSFIPTLSRRYPNINSIVVSIISAILQSTSNLVLRQLAIPVLLIPYYSTQPLGMMKKHHFPTWHDDAFRRVWWVALGWAAAEAIVGIKQGYESIALYKDVLVSVKKSAGRSEMAGAVAGLRGTPIRPMTTREPGTANTHKIDGMPQASSPTSPKTPMADLFDPDTDVESTSYATPTQRNWGRTRALSDDIINGDGALTPQLPPAPAMQREHSDSLASSVNSVPGYGYGSVYNMEGLGNGARDLHFGFDRLRTIDPVAEEREPLLLTLNRRRKTESLLGDANSEQERLMAEVEVERDLEELLALKNREELEEVYGIPVIRIPVFISCLYRINSIISSLAVTLILSAAYMRSTLATYRPSPSPTSGVTSYIQYIFPSSNSLNTMQARPTKDDNSFLIYAFFGLLTIQSVFGMMHTPWILPHIGVHTFVYVQCVVLLALFFGALGIWEVLT